MIGRVEMIGNGKIAFAMAIVGIVARWSDDPIIPAHIAEINIQWPSLTNLMIVFPPVTTSTVRCSSGAICVANRTLLVASVVGVGEQERLSLRPILGTFVHASFKSYVLM